MVAIVVRLLTFPIIIINISHKPYSGMSGYQSNTEKDKGLPQCAKLQDLGGADIVVVMGQ